MHAAIGTVLAGQVVLKGVALPVQALITDQARDAAAWVRLTPFEKAD